jgi:hypothetical protein
MPPQAARHLTLSEETTDLAAKVRSGNAEGRSVSPPRQEFVPPGVAWSCAMPGFSMHPPDRECRRRRAHRLESSQAERREWTLLGG